MEEEKKGCNGHCENCNINQRTYCAAQMAYYNQKEIAAIRADLRKRNEEEVLTLIGGAKAEQEAPTETEECENEG